MPGSPRGRSDRPYAVVVSTRRLVILARRVVVVAIPLVLLSGAAACSKRSGDAPRSSATTVATTTTAGPAAFALAVTVADANGTKPPDDATIAAVKATLDAWVATAVVGPLRTGQPAGDLSPVFTPAALERLADPAVRATLVDEGLPPATKAITPERSTATLFSVAGPDEVTGLVAVQLDLKLRAQGATLDVDVTHYGEVVLVPEGGGWRIDSFTLDTSRDSRT